VEEALAALSAQTYENWRLFVSDNASTDKTWEILRRWAQQDARITIHRQNQNIGALPNFRFVLDMAVSELFMWHACDDRLAPNFLEEMVGIMAAEPECALACSTTVVVEQDGTPARKDSFPPPSGTSRTDRVRQLLAQPQATRIYGLFRIEALRKAQALAEEFGQVWSVDHLQLLELALNDRIRGTDQTSFYFRRGSPSGALYRPTTLSQRLCFAGRYLRFHFRLFGASRLTLSEKVRIAPWLLVHAVRTQYTHPLRRFVKRPIKRLVEIVILGPIRAFR
jgi:glycosyltransferase involved in cell wall biosynthesis